MGQREPLVRLRLLSIGVVLGTTLVLAGCATMGRTAPVTREEIPGLQQRAAQDPGDGAVQLRLGAALMAAGRCEEAMAAAERGRGILPHDPLGPLVIGRCLEEASRFDEALDLYTAFIDANPEGSGVASVQGQRTVALRRQATAVARAAMENEENLGPADPERVGVLPFLVVGDTAYQPLEVGLANMLTTDLALLQRFDMVERVHLRALLDELELPPELIDSVTAARTGRLMQASRMILGTVEIPSEQEARLTSNIVRETGEYAEPFSAQGDYRDLLNLEKEMAIRTAEALGYQLTQAEVQRIRRNVPGNLLAFLAFSRGLMAEDRGDFAAAADHYREAVEADPNYREAQQRMRSSVGAEAVSEAGPGEVTSSSSEVDQVLGLSPAGQTETTGVLTQVLENSIVDVASHQAERATENVGTSSPIEVVGDDSGGTPPLKALIVIIITIPRF